jgi:hypothetical protein
MTESHNTVDVPLCYSVHLNSINFVPEILQPTEIEQVNNYILI